MIGVCVLLAAAVGIGMVVERRALGAGPSRQTGGFKTVDPLEGLRCVLGDDAVAAYLSVYYDLEEAHGCAADVACNRIDRFNRDRVDAR